MRLADVVAASEAIALARGRNEKIDILAGLLRRTPPEEVDTAIAFLGGSPRQDRTGIGPALVWQAREEPPAPDPTLSLREVDETLDRAARLQGKGAGAERSRLIRELFGRATAGEMDFLARLLVGELRQGALEGVSLEAVARAAGVAPDRVRRAVMIAGTLGPVARAALADPVRGLDRFDVRIFQPIKPMLAEAASSVEEAVERFGGAVLEFKMDGARVQVHKGDDEVRVYSRHLREVTPAVPEIVEAVRALPARDLVLDGEVIALRADRAPHPFQVTMRRFGRRLDVETLRSQLPLSGFFFDCLYLDGSLLLDEPLERRIETARGAIPDDLTIPRVAAARPDEAAAFLARALATGHEGVMAKAPHSPYGAGRRGGAWLKVKAARTLDLVVLAAEWGHGRRKLWLSNLHLGARDPARNSYVMLGKTFKGLTDEMLAWQTRKLQEIEIGRDPYTVYERPELVVEVAFNDVQASPHYPGGLALRFARVKAFRSDKPAAEADTIETVRRIHTEATGGAPRAAE